MKLYHKNPRTLSRKQFSQLEEWLRELGDLSGIVHDLNTDEIVGGNQRSRVFDIDKCQVEITQRLDAPDEQGTVALGFIVWEGKRYSYRQVRWTDKQCEKANIVANKSGGEWDWDTLANGFDMGDLLEWGFSEKELAGCDFGLGGEADAEPQIDKAAELQKKWQTETGQLWCIGEHRLLCGDSTKREDVERLMAGEKAALMTTDPPYGVDYGELVRSRKNQKAGGWTDISGDALSDDEMRSMLACSLEGAGAVVAFVWHPAGARRFLFWEALEGNGWRVAQEIVWVKNALVFGRADYQWRHEPCLYAKRDGAPPQNDRTQTTVWECNKPSDSQHPTQKPVELFTRPIKNHTSSGGIVYDPFCGSGTTMVACENLGRKCRAIEIAPGYCAVILERMATAFPGIEIELDATL